MNVALYNLTTTTQYGGVESFVWEVARRLAERGHATTIVGGAGDLRRPYANVRVITFPYLSRAALRRIPGLGKQYTLTKLVERLSFGMNARGFMNRERFDLVHIQKPYDLPFAARVKARAGSRIVFGCHGTDFFPGDRRFVRAADLAVSCSAFNANQVRAHYGITPRVVYNGIDPVDLYPRAVDHGLRRALVGAEASAEASIIFYAGRLVRWKGVQHLIAALAQLAQSRQVVLVIAGEGEYRPALEQRARELGVGDRVRFLGYIAGDRLPRYYAASDIAALASYANETFSIMSCEAMACARPVVGTRFGGIPEVVVDGETGLLAEPENPEDLARQLARLLDDAALRQRLGECGRRRALDLFTWDHVTERVLAAYELTCAS